MLDSAGKPKQQKLRCCTRCLNVLGPRAGKRSCPVLELPAKSKTVTLRAQVYKTIVMLVFRKLLHCGIPRKAEATACLCQRILVLVLLIEIINRKSTERVRKATRARGPGRSRFRAGTTLDPNPQPL